VVLKMDLRDFFPSIPSARIQAVFRTMGYPEPVADRLGGICTNAAPPDAWKNPDMVRRFAISVASPGSRRLACYPRTPAIP
jgi:hypothetical protein